MALDDRVTGKPPSGNVPPWQDRPFHYRASKRALDLAIALPLLVLTLPLQLLIGVLVKLDSTGPALFRQERLGLDARPFAFFKFRSMHVDALERFPELYDYGRIAAEQGDVPLKFARDPRVTRAGRWLRRTSLDELPNLWHVVRGEMSLVGPRPELAALLPCYTPEQFMNFRVKPGLTGLPQTSGRDGLTVAETVALDLQYAKSASLGLDLRILARTVGCVLTGRDAY
jgi:lipopolysaccharide/colanic/teichoic acid biosynthesis glycosyltransferase